jgi:hypothetical protein
VTEAEAEAPAGKVAEAEGAGPEGICMALWKKSLMRVWAGGDAADEVEVDGCGSVIGMVGREGGEERGITYAACFQSVSLVGRRSRPDTCVHMSG